MWRWGHLKTTQTLMDSWQTSETSHSKSSLGNFQHQCLPELLVNVYSYHLMVKSLSCCCVHGRCIFSNLVTYRKWYSIHQILMDCSKFHLMHYIIFLSTGRSEHQKYSHKLNHCLCMTQWKLCYYSIFELSHAFRLLGGFIPVDRLVPGSDLLVCL